MKIHTHKASLFLVLLLINCNNASQNIEEDLKKLFEIEVKNASEGMLIVKDAVQINKDTESTSSEDKKTIDIDYEVTLELTEDAWRLVDSNNESSSNYKLYKNKPKPSDYYGRGQSPMLLKKGDTYKIIRTLKRLKKN